MPKWLKCHSLPFSWLRQEFLRISPRIYVNTCSKIHIVYGQLVFLESPLFRPTLGPNSRKIAYRNLSLISSKSLLNHFHRQIMSWLKYPVLTIAANCTSTYRPSEHLMSNRGTLLGSCYYASLLSSTVYSATKISVGFSGERENTCNEGLVYKEVY